MAERFIVAFNRDRDFYQVPLALAEAGALARLVTDLYLPDLGTLGRSWPFSRLAHRRVEGLPFRLVDWSARALALQAKAYARRENPVLRLEAFKQLDRALARQALRAAVACDAHFLLYSGYALEAFESPISDGRRKGLFVYHPHAKLCERILAEDLEAHPEVAWSHRLHETEMRLTESARLDGELSRATFALCASNFTARTLRHAGHTLPVTVIPYGAFPQQPFPERTDSGPCRFLFVGQGVQRKGLHHLLKAWRRLAPTETEATLDLVVNCMDPGIRSLVPDRGVTVSPPLPKRELAARFAASDVFVMPSLIEGFGLVYLEALAAGCFTIGTSNTGLPDLRAPDWAANVLLPADPEGLLCALEQALERKRRGGFDRPAIRSFAATLGWDAFREHIREACLRDHSNRITRAA